MKMKLLALAVAGAFVAPVAMAEHEEGAAAGSVIVYGQVSASYDNVKSGLTAGDTTNNNVSSNATRIGFKGSEDLGGGTSAIWQIESLLDIDGNNSDNNGTTFSTRNTFVGLSGASWGTVIMGRHDSPYKVATRGLDMFADTIADNRSIMGLAGIHDTRLNNAAAYLSPSMSGFSLAIATVAGAENAVNGDNKGSAWSGYAMYNAGPINASLSYQTVTFGSTFSGSLGNDNFGGLPANDKSTAWKLAGGYTMDMFQVNAVYEKVGSSGTIGDLLDRHSWYLAGKYNVTANDGVKLAYTSAGKLGSAVDTEANQWSVGVDHMMSKRTTVYALYTKLTNKANAAYAIGGSGISTAASTPGFDADPSAFSLGIKHSF